MEEQNKDTRYYIDLDFKKNTIINYGYGNRFELSKNLEGNCGRIFITKGQYNKIIDKI